MITLHDMHAVAWQHNTAEGLQISDFMPPNKFSLIN